MNCKIVFSAVFLWFAVSVFAAGGLLVNGDFSKGVDWHVPDGWFFARQGDAQAEMQKVGAALRIANRSAKAPNVYGMLQQSFPAEAGVEYVLAGQLKGNGSLTFALGKGWRTRFAAKAPQEFRFRFKLEADQLEKGKAVLAVLSESPADGLELSGLSVEKFIAPPVAAKDNYLENGSFENGPAGGVPSGWHFSSSGNAEATMRVDGSDAADGKCSLSVVNRSPRKPNVYGMLVQFAELRPGVSYELTGRMRGKNAEPVLFLIGKKWDIRLRPGVATSEWKPFRLTFSLTPDEFEADGKVAFRIICEGLTEELHLDDLVLREEKSKVIAPAAFQKNEVWRVEPFNRSLDGLTAIPAGLPVLTVPASAANCSTGKMPQTFSGRVALGYDEKGLIFFLEAKDPTAHLEIGDAMWRGDSVQIRIDQAGKSAPGEQDSDFEFGLAVGADSRVHTWSWNRSAELPTELTQAVGVRTSAGYFAAIRLDWKLLSSIHFPEQRYFTFTAVFNSSDRPGHRDVYFLTPGLHDTKSAVSYVRALLAAPGRPVGGVRMADSVAPEQFKGRLTATGLDASSSLEAVLKGAKGEMRTIPLGSVANLNRDDVLELDYALPLDRLGEGEVEVKFLAGGKPFAGFRGVKSDPVKMQTARLADAIARHGRLKKEFAAFYGEKSPSAYVSIPLAVLGDMLPQLRDWMTGAAGKRGAEALCVTRLEMVMPSVEESLGGLEKLLGELKAGRKLPETWRYVSGPVELRGGWPYAGLVSSTGERETRPVMFDGYGHFTNMRSSLDRFPEYGANIIQLELGPSHLYPKEGANQEFEADFSGFENDRLSLIERCWKDNLQLCLLISPHYAPGWWLAKHPEVKNSSGFLTYNILRPEAREMMTAHIRDLVGRLRKLPHPEVIHSICLQNEPIYTADWNDPFTRGRFEAFLKEKYGSAEKFNLAAGISDKAVNAAWIEFRKQVMNDWNGFLASEVRKAWPGIPVHSKIMIMNSTFSDHGIDPEAFALVSDYNGNDNYGNYMEGGYASDWVGFALGSELQYSMRPNSLVNAENHIIRDSEKRPIPNTQVYVANFLQHLTGASALITWVWNIYPPEQEAKTDPALRDNIALRPGNVAAQGLAQLDAMRLAPELIQFTKTEPVIALLYSPSTLGVQASAYKNALARFYAETAFTGHRVRFLSERQLAEGQFGKVKQLFVVGAPNVSAEALAGMRNFVKQGGRIFADRFSLKRDELDRALKSGVPTEPLADFITASELKAKYFDPVEPLPVNPAAVVPGVFCRVVPGVKPGETLVALINYNKEPAEVKLKGKGAYRDLIRDEPVSAGLKLEPLQVMLVRAE